MCFLHMYVLRLGSGAARRGGPVLPFLNHGVRMQAEADRDGVVHPLHLRFVQPAHMLSQPPLSSVRICSSSTTDSLGSP
mgnify:CR=1 FL=1